MDDTTSPPNDPATPPMEAAAPMLAAQGDTETGSQGEPASPLSPASSSPRLSIARGRLGRAAFWVFLVIICAGILLWARSFGTRVVQSQPVNARIEITNPPAWLDRRIVQSLLDESYQFAGHDAATYDRTRDILDAGILKEFANVYTGSDPDGKPHQAIGYNAWISKVTQVRRNIAADNGMQAIQIVAQWRQPAAWIRATKDGEPMLYLIDAAGTRLPGEYHLSDRTANNPLMVIAGVDVPSAGVPAPGEKWFAQSATRDAANEKPAQADGAMGDDLSAALQLMNLLNRQRYASQIAAINMANFSGRGDPMASWIVLETIWPTAVGTPRVVEWGRPAGAEKYYEIQASAKLKTLNELYNKFGRIDANHDYVDIRTDFVRTPKIAAQGDGDRRALATELRDAGDGGTPAQIRNAGIFFTGT